MGCRARHDLPALLRRGHRGCRLDNRPAAAHCTAPGEIERPGPGRRDGVGSTSWVPIAVTGRHGGDRRAAIGGFIHAEAEACSRCEKHRTPSKTLTFALSLLALPACFGAGADTHAARGLDPPQRPGPGLQRTGAARQRRPAEIRAGGRDPRRPDRLRRHERGSSEACGTGDPGDRPPGTDGHARASSTGTSTARGTPTATWATRAGRSRRSSRSCRPASIVPTRPRTRAATSGSTRAISSPRRSRRAGRS